jgi:D-3-phosphoglycerate dehydrogenase
MDILISEEVDAPAVQALASRFAVLKEPTLWTNASLLKERVREARAIMVRNQTRVDAELLANAPDLVAVGRVGVGLDNIDLQTATEMGVVVIAPLNANATSVAELTVGLILSLARKIPFGDRSTRSGSWDRKGCTGIELDGKTLVICGFGRIGRLVAARARSFGLKLAVFDPFVRSDSDALREVGARHFTNLNDALASADFVTVHSPLTAETRHMFNQRSFSAMKPGAFFINTSRGGVVDERALLAALESGKLGGAALDVRESEPPGRSAFETMDNVVLTPHIAAFTREAQTRTIEAVCEDLDRVLRGEPAVNYVNLAQPKPRPIQ